MRGRIKGEKKSNVLLYVFIINTLLFLTLVMLNIFVFKDYPTLWFYDFCLMIGLYQILKSRLLKLDSGFYLGTLLTLIATSGFIYLFTQTNELWYLYILTDFFLASILTLLICGQRFHLIFGYILLFVIIFTILFKFSLITLSNFIAILVSFLLILLVIVVLSIWRRK